MSERRPESYQEYVDQCVACVERKQGKRLADLLCFRRFSAQLRNAILNPPKKQASDNVWAIMKAYIQRMALPWRFVVFHHLRALRYHHLTDKTMQALAASKKSCSELQKQIEEDANSNAVVWYLPSINAVLSVFTEVTIAHHEELLAMEDEEEMTGNHVIGDSFRRLSQLIRLMTSSHSGSGGAQSLSQGLFFTVNKVIRLSDVINNSTYFSHALEQVDQYCKNHYSRFPLADVVTHLYYAGRFSASRDELFKAYQKLGRALELCHRRAFRNKQRILLLLIPVQLLFGVLPSDQLLAKYRLDQHFSPVVHSLRRGDIHGFREAMRCNETAFINTECFLLLERLEVLVLKRLLQRVFQVRTDLLRRVGKEEAGFGKPHVIPSKQILEAAEILSAGKLRLGTDEMECMVANLIAKRLVKGYIAQGKAVVLHAHSPFRVLTPNDTEEWWKW